MRSASLEARTRRWAPCWRRTTPRPCVDGPVCPQTGPRHHRQSGGPSSRWRASSRPTIDRRARRRSSKPLAQPNRLLDLDARREAVSPGIRLALPRARRQRRHGASAGAPTVAARGRRRGVIDILVNGIPGTAMMAAWSLSEREIAQVAAYVRSLGRRPAEALPGDPARGQAVLRPRRLRHLPHRRWRGLGLGPDLSDVGTRRGSAFLRESLIDPGAARPERPVPYEPYGYPAYVVVRAQPRGGAEVLGMRVNEDTFTIQLRDQQGRLHSFRKAELQTCAPNRRRASCPAYRDTLKGARDQRPRRVSHDAADAR